MSTGNSVETMSWPLKISRETLCWRLRELIAPIHNRVVKVFVTRKAMEPFTSRDDFLTSGPIVDATIQQRGEPVGRYQEKRFYESSLRALKSQVITTRSGTSVHIIAAFRLESIISTCFRRISEALKNWSLRIMVNRLVSLRTRAMWGQ
jgi:hypothetical protein